MSATANALLGLMSQTPVHAGAGASEDVIDLPVQREAHSDWPCIFGSSVKGALRAHAELNGGLDQDQIVTLFGPETRDASEHAGALLVSDARLLLLPVRSLNSHFRRVTCPALLRRLGRDLQRLDVGGIPEIPEVAAGKAVSAEPVHNNSLYLEEFRLDTQQQDLGAWVDCLAGVAGGEYHEELAQQLVIVSDDDFRHLCRNALPVQPHIRLNSETKTVEGGALWYEENLAPDTLLYVGLHTHRARSEREEDALTLRGQLLDGLFGKHPYVQIGGNETTGMGWFRVETLTGREADAA